MDGNSGRFTYYGFTNAVEREFFEALLSVASIGPRSQRARSRSRCRPSPAPSTAATMPRCARCRGSAAKGARYRRQAARQSRAFSADREAEPAPPVAMPDFAEEAHAVLLQLGYKRAEADA